MEEEVDLVIAAGYLRCAHSEDDDVLTRLRNWMLRTLSNLLLKARGSAYITDPIVVFRVYL